MVEKVKLFVNDNKESKKFATIAKRKLEAKGFNVTDGDDFRIAIAIGGDGGFIRMVAETGFNEELYYVGINTGHLGFLQEIKKEDLDKFIDELIDNRFKIEKVGVQETYVNANNKTYKHYSLNEIVIRDENLDLVKTNIYVNGDLLEYFNGDGVLVSTSVGSTAQNISYGGSIVFPDCSTLQITSMAPINTKRYSTLINSVIVPKDKVIKFKLENSKVRVTIDGIHHIYNNIDTITSTIGNRYINCLRFSHYNFPQKINEKLISR